MLAVTVVHVPSDYRTTGTMLYAGGPRKNILYKSLTYLAP
jgi:hypothetical protein